MHKYGKELILDLHDCDINTLKDCIYAKNYWEAAGLIMCMQAGIDKNSVRRPL